jgi:hypothetical protein
MKNLLLTSLHVIIYATLIALGMYIHSLPLTVGLTVLVFSLPMVIVLIMGIGVIKEYAQ